MIVKDSCEHTKNLILLYCAESEGRKSDIQKPVSINADLK